MADTARPFNHHGDVTSLAIFQLGRVLIALGRRVEPSQAHAAVGTRLQKRELARGFQFSVEGEPATLDAVEPRTLIAKDDSADLAWLAAGVIGLAESKIVQRSNDALGEFDIVPRADPFRVGVECFTLAVDDEIVEIDIERFA